MNLEDSSAVVVLDTRALKVLARWPLAAGRGADRTGARPRAPSAVLGLRQWEARRARRRRTDAGSPRCRSGRAWTARPSTRRGLVFTSNGEGTVTVIHEDGVGPLSRDRDRDHRTGRADAGARRVDRNALPADRRLRPTVGADPGASASAADDRAGIVPGAGGRTLVGAGARRVGRVVCDFRSLRGPPAGVPLRSSQPARELA